LQEAVGVSGFLQEGFLGTTIKGALKRPGVGLPALGLGALFTADVLGPVAGGLRDRATGRSTLRTERANEARIEQIRQQELLQIQQKRLERAMMLSATRLAATNPQLYNEVLAGRRLPLGAVVIGGRPRTDLLEQLALDMAEGNFDQGPGPDQQLASLLGGS